MRYRRGPFGDFFEMQEQMDQMFETFFQDRAAPTSSTWHPPMDVYETTDTFIVRVELPGIRPTEDLTIELVENVLTIKGYRRDRTPRNKQHYHLAEVTYGSFERAIRLPEAIHDEGQPEARYENGFLEVVLPKMAQALVRNIPVKTAGDPRPAEVDSTQPEPDPSLPNPPRDEHDEEAD